MICLKLKALFKNKKAMSFKTHRFLFKIISDGYTVAVSITCLLRERI